MKGQNKMKTAEQTALATEWKSALRRMIQDGSMPAHLWNAKANGPLEELTKEQAQAQHNEDTAKLHEYRAFTMMVYNYIREEAKPSIKGLQKYIATQELTVASHMDELAIVLWPKNYDENGDYKPHFDDDDYDEDGNYKEE